MSAPGPSEPARARGPIAIPWLVAALASAWVLVGTQPERSYSDTLFSRLATVYSLAHHATFAIEPEGEENPFAARTVDKVEFSGRIVSSKPPVLPLLMTAEYLVLNRLAGWRLDDPDSLARITWVMTVSLVGVPFVLLVWSLTRAAQSVVSGPMRPAFVGIAAIAGTHAGALAVVFNNHVPAAAFVVVCCHIALRIVERSGPARAWELLVFGLAAALAATIDLPTAIFPALFGLLLLRREPRRVWLYVLPPAIALLSIQFIALGLATGNPLPAQLSQDAYLFENSYWRNPLGVDALNDPPAIYLFHILLGRVGVFSLFPVTLLALPGTLLLRQAPRPFVAVNICALVGAIVLTAYYAYATNNYGGASFGFRWLVVLGPLLLLVGAPAVGRLSKPWHWLIPILLLLASAYSTWQGSQTPWLPNSEWTVRVFGPSL